MKTFQEKSMLVRFSSGIGFSCRKKDKKVTKEVARSKEADEDSVDVFKRLLPKGALDAWQDAIEAAREVHEKLTLPWRDDGYRILKSSQFEEYTAAMRKHRRLVEAQRDLFVEKYPSYRDAAPARLNGMFDPKDFPPVDKLVKRFKFKTDVLPVPSGDDFRVDIAEEDLAEIRKEIDAAGTSNLIKNLIEPIRHMAARLSDPEAVFRNTLVTNLQDILKLLPEGDPEVDNLVAQIKADLIRDPQQLRESPSTRRATAVRANEILATMAGYLPADAGPAAEPIQLPPDTVTLGLEFAAAPDPAPAPAAPVPPPLVVLPDPEPPTPTPEPEAELRSIPALQPLAMTPLPSPAPVPAAPAPATTPAWRRRLCASASA